jgi:hypothetical protein
MIKDKTNEGSTANLALTFYDQDNALVTPSAARYRIDDVSSATMIRDWTEFTPSGTTHDLKILAVENRILNDELAKELHRVTIQYDYGTEDQGTGQIDFYVINLFKMPWQGGATGTSMSAVSGSAIATAT